MNNTPAVTNSDVPASSPNCVKIDIEGFYNMSAVDQEAALEAAVYIGESGSMIVNYFHANTATWRGDDARRIMVKLNRMMKNQNKRK